MIYCMAHSGGIQRYQIVTDDLIERRRKKTTFDVDITNHSFKTHKYLYTISEFAKSVEKRKEELSQT